MQGSVRICIESLLERVGLRNKYYDIGYIVAKYVCKLIGSNRYRQEIRLLLIDYPDVQEELIALKDDLDHSVKKNNLFRALHYLSRYTEVSKVHVVEAAQKYHVDYEDVGFFFSLMQPPDLDLICGQELPDFVYSDEDILKIFNELEHYITTLAYRKLGFVLKHDPAIDSVKDLVSSLQLGALKALREYEVQKITSDHLTALMARSVKNCAINTASSSGRLKRRKVSRVHEHQEFRHAFHLDIDNGCIREVVLNPSQEYRIKHEGNLLIKVKHVDQDGWFVVHMKRLYETFEEAEQAYARHLNGQRSKRPFFIDPSPQQIDDFQLSTLSIDGFGVNTENDSVFYDTFIEDETVDLDYSLQESDLRQRIGPKVSKFAEYLFSSALDALFLEWCNQHGYDAAVCTYPQLGKLVCKYMGVRKEELKQELLDTPAFLWSDSEVRFFRSNLTDH